jgi:hypothetical protein
LQRNNNPLLDRDRSSANDFQHTRKSAIKGGSKLVALDDKRRKRNLLDGTNQQSTISQSKSAYNPGSGGFSKGSKSLKSAVNTIKTHAKVAPHLRSHNGAAPILAIDPKKIANDVSE